MEQVGIFGGTFDPIHWGHLLVAQTALSQVPLEKIILVPSVNPPHKKASLFHHRWQMLQLATRENPAFIVSPVEAKRSGISYAINTLMDLSNCYLNTRWYWILGLDTFKTLPRWYCGHQLAQMCNWLIAPRIVGAETIIQSELICKQVEQQLTEESLTIDWQLLNTPLVGISSSLIRKLCRQGQSIRYLVPNSVSCYINTHKLYSGKAE
ncbi:nicotinate (nicotinamide) nucleotide adenylyltransferase [Umezakia ovalisporum]|jgi:nicotinate-nucleotide adenylyltransferase|uniref:Probable nicotinate-nucleotide adenylyltransferase n=2 Tax=Umezakia ovalisporum TaxID=75695 RepID=A0AA43H1F7_9CYAN|nr:nicotinate (nicotinamide) nucleotide adenylyltransferase [Umezakia ovalisporum]MBI1240390.1 nicotinate (nicotinamide) nucleotide adenylyltransferase [Nostoc sp. RI_552]MDH6056006.1 nicotinate (nicotinamide) nucleotide adenylyltransferase [Umezakia ovalisporum FSS-43]MDH6065515.1 nicotinate (nicotinamide) nucleotide adenylyltransferase [Umezakia ovalisporum FSS-62]MDH6066100.1 nicotinate (nicotinamide) nucleotide adenylyltransferase [Umezakia ovalisporum APH033B]MDH6072638.1 nicotinate (nico